MKEQTSSIIDKGLSERTILRCVIWIQDTNAVHNLLQRTMMCYSDRANLFFRVKKTHGEYLAYIPESLDVLDVVSRAEEAAEDVGVVVLGSGGHAEGH